MLCPWEATRAPNAWRWCRTSSTTLGYGKVLHVDFHEVAENERIAVNVPLETVGEAAGVKNSGGVLEHVLFKLKVRCLPKDLPEQIVVDVSHLELGKAIHIGEIKAPEGVEIIGDKNIPVIAVAMPRTEEEEAAATEVAPAAAGDVEMIKEKKEEGEEGAAPAEGRNPAKGAGRAAKGAEKAPAAAAAGAKAPAAADKVAREETGGERNNFSGLGFQPDLDRQDRLFHYCPRMENLHLIVGLGNPGADYAKTRHNAGFLLVEKLAVRWKADWKNERRFGARIARSEQDGRRVLLCQPQTFMNSNGETVGALKKFYQLPLERLLVAVDDADLPLGEIRLRASGSSGGHHGLESIEQQIWPRAGLRGCGSASAGRSARGKSRITCSRVSARTRRR